MCSSSQLNPIFKFQEDIFFSFYNVKSILLSSHLGCLIPTKIQLGWWWRTIHVKLMPSHPRITCCTHPFISYLHITITCRTHPRITCDDVHIPVLHALHIPWFNNVHIPGLHAVHIAVFHMYTSHYCIMYTSQNYKLCTSQDYMLYTSLYYMYTTQDYMMYTSQHYRIMNVLYPS